MINRTDAWKCTDGTCFDVGDKEKAYNHEIKTLMQTLPRGNDRQITSFHLKRLTDEVNKWLLRANEFNEGLKRAPRDRGLDLVKDFARLVKEVKAWVESAESLSEQISKETDVETKRAVTG